MFYFLHLDKYLNMQKLPRVTLTQYTKPKNFEAMAKAKCENNLGYVYEFGIWFN